MGTPAWRVGAGESQREEVCLYRSSWQCKELIQRRPSWSVPQPLRIGRCGSIGKSEYYKGSPKAAPIPSVMQLRTEDSNKSPLFLCEELFEKSLGLMLRSWRAPSVDGEVGFLGVLQVGKEKERGMDVWLGSGLWHYSTHLLKKQKPKKPQETEYFTAFDFPGTQQRPGLWLWSNCEEEE